MRWGADVLEWAAGYEGPKWRKNSDEMREITDKEAIGKTIKEFLYSDSSRQMIICFDDETFTMFEIEGAYDV